MKVGLYTGELGVALLGKIRFHCLLQKTLFRNRKGPAKAQQSNFGH